MPIARPRLAARGRVGAVAGAAGAIALLMTGCVGASEPTPTPTPTDVTIAPIFATDEEALAAAVSAYEAYSSASAAVAATGDSDLSHVLNAVTPAYADTLRAEFDALSDAGLRMTGDTKIWGARLAESAFDESGANISIYLCRDVSEVRVLDADGTDVTPVDRDETTPTQAFLVSSTDDPTVLLVNGVERWTGDDFC